MYSNISFYYIINRVLKRAEVSDVVKGKVEVVIKIKGDV